MSAAEADRFITDLTNDPDQFAEIEQLGLAGNADAAYAKLKALGYDATQEEIREAFLEYASEHLDDDQLAAVAGGLSDAGAAALGSVGAFVAGAALAAAAAA
jgi:predicted ribosomally synthesized peptide with nif11-like leader